MLFSPPRVSLLPTSLPQTHALIGVCSVRAQFSPNAWDEKIQSQILPEIFDRPGYFGILMKRAFIEQFYYRVKQSQAFL